MTAEEKREQLLKRILPCMVIIIIYFVFISGLFSEKMEKAETSYTKLRGKGVSLLAIPNALNRQQQTQTQITKLETKQRELKQKLSNLAGFLSSSTPSNESSTRLSSILAENNIQVKNEQQETFPEAELSPALQEVWQWLKPAEETAKKESSKKQQKSNHTVFVQHLSLTGSYQNLYLAMNSIAKGDLKAVPVYLNMKAPVDSEGTPDALDWELLLWM